MSKVIGITVGTPISKEKIKEISGEVKTVNGVKPDDNGDVKITIPKQVTIDNSLSVEGAAADSKAVGDKFNEHIGYLAELQDFCTSENIKSIVDEVINEALAGDY